MFTTRTSDITIASLGRMNRETLAESILLTGSLPPNTAIIDVRDDDHIGGHIKGSINVPSSQLDYRLPELTRKLKDKEKVIFHCALSQQRGPKAAMGYLRERERLLGDQGKASHGQGKAEGEAEAGDEVGGDEKITETQERELKSVGTKTKAQEVFVLDGGFVKWQEKYGKDAKLTDAYVEDIWRDGY